MRQTIKNLTLAKKMFKQSEHIYNKERTHLSLE